MIEDKSLQVQLGFYKKTRTGTHIFIPEYLEEAFFERLRGASWLHVQMMALGAIFNEIGTLEAERLAATPEEREELDELSEVIANIYSKVTAKKGGNN